MRQAIQRLPHTFPKRLHLHLKGHRLFLLPWGYVCTLSTARLRSSQQLSPKAHQLLRALVCDLARRHLNPAQLRHLMAYAARQADLCILLRAICFPQLLALPILLEDFEATDEADPLLLQQGVKPYLRHLVGPLTDATRLLTDSDRLAFACALHRSGMTSPDLKATVLRCVPAHSGMNVPPKLDFRWLVEALGERLTAQRLAASLGAQVTVAPRFIPLPRSQATAQRPSSLTPLTVAAAPFSSPRWAPLLKSHLPKRLYRAVDARSVTHTVEDLIDTAQLLKQLRVSYPTLALPSGTLHAVCENLRERSYRTSRSHGPTPPAQQPSRQPFEMFEDDDLPF